MRQSARNPVEHSWCAAIEESLTYYRQHDPLRAEIVQRRRRRRIDHAELRAHVQRDVRRIALGQRDHAEIGRDDCVHARIVEQLEVRGQLRHLVITRQGIARHMHGSALCVRKLHGSADAVRREVFRTGAHTKLRPGEIHCVRAEMERHLQALQISGGAQQLRFIHATPPLIVSNSVWPRTPGIRRSS